MLKGKRISGRYKIIDMIGGGGMANVYLAHDMILDRDVALKILRLDFANDDEFIRRFHREAQSATSLVHPNIVSIYDVGEEEGIYYIVMEYVDGQTLKQYIQKNSPVPVEFVIEIMKQLTSAIDHAHQNHIVHRDIKPQNILIDHNRNVKITDFGIAMALSATAITQTNSVLGSVHYLSPEQARGGMANKKSDIYSLGIVMFELLTGRLPFSGESAVSIALKHLQSETPSLRRWNPEIPQSVENIVLKATAKDPFHRYEDVVEMAEDLQTALNPERINEMTFSIPEDIEATKAIPIITNERPYKNFDETIIHEKDQVTPTKEDLDGKPKKKKKQTQNKKNKQKKKGPIILLITFAVLIIFAILSFTVLPSLLKPKEIEIPDVSGKDIDDAIYDLIELGFEIGDTIDLADNEIPENHIVKTTPKAGKKVRKGTEITLYKSIGKEKYQLSDYRDRQYDTVLALLEEMGFERIEKQEIYDEREVGTILEQSIPAGDEVVPDETTIIFTVSKGQEKISLKDLRELNVKSVLDYSDTTGLTIEIKEDYHDEIAKELVIAQSPEPGTLLNKGAKVTVVVSKGKKEIPPQTIVKEITIPYEPEIAGEPQEVQIFVEDMNHSMTEPFETIYITEPIKKRLEFLIGHGQKAGYKVFRDKKVIMEETIPFPE